MPLIEKEGTHPEGLSVAEWLQKELALRGVDSALDNWRDSGYSLDCRIEEIPVYFVVSSAADRPARWLGMCASDRGFFEHIFRGPDTRQRHKLATIVHEALTNDERVEDLRWHSEWNGDLDDPGQRTPPEP